MTLLELTEAEIKAMIDPAMKIIPTPKQVFDEALASVPANKLEPTYIRSHFSDAIVLVAHDAFAKFKVYQRKATKPIIQSFIKKYGNELNTISTQEVLEIYTPLAMRFEMRTSQMRKSRAGSTFEMITQYLLQRSGINCEITSKDIRKKLHRMDIVVPNATVALKSSDKAAFLSLKHTLRERWKQALPDKNRNWIMYLITLDDDIADDKAREMAEHNMIVYVKDEVKAQPYLVKKDWIRRLSDLPGELKRFC